MRRSRLEKVAVALVAAAGPETTVLVGGLAVALHGYVRATDDVDILVREPLSEVQAKLAAKGIQAELRRGDPFEGDFSCLRGEMDGIRFDVLPELAPVSWDELPELTIRGVRIRIVDLPGLLALKFRAQGPQDLLDAAALVLLHPEVEDIGRRLAVTYRVADRMKRLLENTRLRSQILGSQ